MTQIFLTGITGLLGGNLVIDLLNQGYAVKALLRNKATYRGEKHPNLTLIQGGLLDDISDHLSGVAVFVHVAAETKPNLLSYAHYQKINFEATKSLFESCEKCGVQKFIFVSTANTLAYGSLEKPGNENIGIRYPFTKSMYAKSKLEAEEFLLSKNGQTQLNIINPTFMIGAYDHKPSSGRIILMGLDKKIIFYPPGGKNFVDVKDVSQGIIKAIELGNHGERYLTCGENLTYKEFFTKMNCLTGQKPIMVKIPSLILNTLGFLGNFLRFFGIKTAMSIGNMKALCIHNYYSNKKSIKKLGLNYTNIDNAILDAVAFFRKNRKSL